MKPVWNWESRSYGFRADFAHKNAMVSLRVLTYGNGSVGWSAEARGLHGLPLPKNVRTEGVRMVFGDAKTKTRAKRWAERWGNKLAKTVL